LKSVYPRGVLGLHGFEEDEKRRPGKDKIERLKRQNTDLTDLTDQNNSYDIAIARLRIPQSPDREITRSGSIRPSV